MSDAAIKAALDAAVNAAWPGDEAIYADEHGGPEAMIAAAIAAFLRAAGMWQALAEDGTEALAAAVEAAAHDR